jgi:hypothetical protein
VAPDDTPSGWYDRFLDDDIAIPISFGEIYHVAWFKAQGSPHSASILLMEFKESI